MLILFVKLLRMVKKDKKINLISEERRTHDLQSVAKMMMPLAKNLLGKKGFTEIELLSNWQEIVGDDIASYTLPKQIIAAKGNKDGGCLRIEVPSGAFALELQLREKIIREKINFYFGYQAISNISIIQNSELSFSDDVQDMQGGQKILVTKEEENYIKDLSDGVENPNLRQKLIELGRSIISNNKGGNQNEV